MTARDVATLTVRPISAEDREALAGAFERLVAVFHNWQGRGVGTELLRRVATRAREAGIESLAATCLASNHEIQDLLPELGPHMRTRPVGEEVGMQPDGSAPDP